MDTNSLPPSVTPELAITPDDHPGAFARAFAASIESGDPAIVESVYEESAVLVTDEGRLAVGADRQAALTEHLSLGIPISVNPRNVIQSGDTALLIVDWAIVGRSQSGQSIDLRGTATDVARRGADGYWRYVIDNPFGITLRG
jgi:ketosteroid isomerase-like protein